MSIAETRKIWESMDEYRAMLQTFQEKLMKARDEGEITRKEYQILCLLLFHSTSNKEEDKDTYYATDILPVPEEFARSMSLGVRTAKNHYKNLRKKGYIQLLGYTPEQEPVYKFGENLKII